MVKGMTVLALDERTHQLVQPLTVYCGIGAHNDVDSALAAILWRRPIILHGSRSEDVLELARTIHDHSIRKGFPFLQVNTVPTNDAPTRRHSPTRNSHRPPIAPTASHATRPGAVAATIAPPRPSRPRPPMIGTVVATPGRCAGSFMPR